MWAGQGAGWPGQGRTHACSPGSSSVVHVPGVNDIQSSSSSGQNLSQISRQLSQSQVAWTGSRPPFPGQVRPGRAPPTAAPGGAPHGAPEIPALGGAEHSRAPGPHATAVRVRGGKARSPAARGARPRQARGDLDLPPPDPGPQPAALRPVHVGRTPPCAWPASRAPGGSHQPRAGPVGAPTPVGGGNQPGPRAGNCGDASIPPRCPDRGPCPLRPARPSRPPSGSGRATATRPTPPPTAPSPARPPPRPAATPTPAWPAGPPASVGAGRGGDPGERAVTPPEHPAFGGPSPAPRNPGGGFSAPLLPGSEAARGWGVGGALSDWLRRPGRWAEAVGVQAPGLHPDVV